MAEKSKWGIPQMSPVGWLATAGVAFMAWNAWKTLGQGPAPGPGQPQQATLQQVQAPGGTMLVDDSNPAMGGGLMGMDPNGIPIVALPASSARHSRSVQRAPSWGDLQASSQQQAPAATDPNAHPYAAESFGGMGVSGMGGEGF